MPIELDEGKNSAKGVVAGMEQFEGQPRSHGGEGPHWGICGD